MLSINENGHVRQDENRNNDTMHCSDKFGVNASSPFTVSALHLTVSNNTTKSFRMYSNMNIYRNTQCIMIKK